MRVEAVAITREEGGEWEPFVKHQKPASHKGHLVHSIRFSDGSEWDANNGWRPERK